MCEHMVHMNMYDNEWKRRQICGNLSGKHNDSREDNLVDGRVHFPISQ
jgi:hypothetical protein